MRRADKEIAEREAIENVIRRSLVCRLALVDDGRPYVVPLSFGYEAGTLYFHSAPAGRKLDILRGNAEVCIEFDADVELVRGRNACGCTLRYRSVIGFGAASLVEDREEKRAALGAIMRQYAGGGPFEFPDADVDRTAVFKVAIRTMTGKKSGY